MSQHVASDPTTDFLRRWAHSGAAERANYQLFLSELCDVLGVPRPDPTVPDDSQNAYVFERAVHFHNGYGTTSPGRIDLYKRGCFVLDLPACPHPRRPRNRRTLVSLGQACRVEDRYVV